MTKTICDRCLAEIRKTNQLFTPTYQIKRHTGEVEVNVFAHNEYMADVDLCPKCMEEFEEFMAGRMLLHIGEGGITHDPGGEAEGCLGGGGDR